jgi:excisionase family DNA binding protein
MKLDVYSVAQAAEVLGCSRTAVYDLVRRGTLAPRYVGRTLFFTHLQLRDLVCSPGYQERKRADKSQDDQLVSLGLKPAGQRNLDV